MQAPSLQTVPAGGPYVEDTLDLMNNTLVPGNFLATNCVAPRGDASDPTQGELFVACSYTNELAFVSDTSGALLGGVQVGSEPEGVAFDSGRGEVFVANFLSNDVSVVSETTRSIVATIPVGSEPLGIVYDQNKSEVFVANSGGNQIEVISDSTNRVVTNVTVGSGPGALALDDATGEVYVADAGNGSVCVFSDANDSVVTTIPIGGGQPSGISYDGKLAEIFVANEFWGNVTVISAPAHKTVASIVVGSMPEGLAYDPQTNETFVANYNADNVRVIQDSTNSVVASVGVGLQPNDVVYDQDVHEVLVVDLNSNNVSAISDTLYTVNWTAPIGIEPRDVSYDPSLGEVFVTIPVLDSVMVISDLTRKVIATIPVGYNPVGLAYDAGVGETFVANANSNNVSVISDRTLSVVATVAVGWTPVDLAYDSGRGEIWVINQNTCDVSVISDLNDSVLATIGSCSGPLIPEGIAYDAGKGEMFVSDLSADLVAVIADNNYTTLSNVSVGLWPTSLAYDEGRGEVFAVDSASSAASVISDFSNAVTSTVSVGRNPYGIVYDSSHGAILIGHQSDEDYVTIISDSTSTTLANLSVGLSPSYLAYDTGLDVDCVSNSYQGTISFVAWPSTPPLKVTATTDKLSGSAPVQVNFTSNATGGTGNYSGWAWHFGDGGSSSLPDPSHVYVSPGNYTAWVNVTDTSETVSQSNLLQMAVSKPLSGPTVSSFVASPNPVTVGSPTDLAVNATGGVGALAYTYDGLPSGCSSTSTASLACTPASTGNYTVRVFVNDSGGHSTNRTTNLEVNPVANVLSSVTVIPSSVSVLTGATRSFSANVTCTLGACPIRAAYSWVLHGNVGRLNSSTGNMVAFTAGRSVGTAVLEVQVQLEGKLGWANASISVAVAPTSSTPPPIFLGLPEPDGYLLLGVIAGVAACSIVTWLILRKRRDAQSAQSSAVPPSRP